MSCVPLASKSRRFRLRTNNNSGIILIVVLWVLLILTVLALSLGRKTGLEMALSRHAIAKTKSRYLSWAGVMFAVNQLRQDSEDSVSKNEDTLYACGIKPSESVPPEEVFEKRAIANGSFSVDYRAAGASVTYPGMMDEERKLNLNSLAAQNIDVLVSLITFLGYDETVAKTVAYSLIDWTDANDSASDAAYGAENDYYENLPVPYRPKNYYLESKEELLMVRGMTRAIYDAIEDYVTIFPQRVKFTVNLETAPETVLRALARGLSGTGTSTTVEDADSLVDKILDYRAGDDGTAFTKDDRLVDMTALPLNAKERVIGLQMVQYRTKKSEYFRIRARGVEEPHEVKTTIEAVVRRNDLKILEWHRN